MNKFIILSTLLLTTINICYASEPYYKYISAYQPQSTSYYIPQITNINHNSNSSYNGQQINSLGTGYYIQPTMNFKRVVPAFRPLKSYNTNYMEVY